MDRLSQFLMDNVSNLTSARSITDTLTSNKDKINHKTVGNYLTYLCNAFAFYKFRRYDIKGNKYLASNDKYYLSDHTFRYAKLGTKNLDNGKDNKIRSFNEMTDKDIRKAHNIQKMYKAGAFNGE